MSKNIQTMSFYNIFNIVVAVFLLSCCTVTVRAQSTAVSRCFKFTWLGPLYNNQSQFLNATCADATRLASGVPCMEPLVASYDGTWPDVDYIWNNHAQDATCILATNDVCAQYTYYFNGIAENSTYMCTRAINNNDAAITSGCYQQINGSFTTRVCFCRSVPGGVPCNNAVLNSFISTSVVVFALFLVINRSFCVHFYQ